MLVFYYRLVDGESNKEKLVTYTYATAEKARYRERHTFLFRQSERGIEIQITRRFDSPDGIGLKTFQRDLKNMSKDMREAKLRTTVSTMDEYYHEIAESTLSITGWIIVKSDAHKELLKTATPFA